MPIAKLKSNEINPNTAMKDKINEIIDALNGTNTTVSRDVINSLLIDLPTANVASPGFYLNTNVVTKGTL